MADFDPDAYLKKKQPSAAAPFDPDAYLKSTTPETAAQSFGRGAASLADTALNAVTGTLDLGARAAARAYYGGIQGMRGDALEQKIAQETTSPKDVVGRTFGVTGTAGYENAPLRAVGRELAPVIQENVINPIASATGQSPEYVSDVVGIGTMAVAPSAGRATAATGRAVVGGVKGGIEAGRGAYGAFTGDIAKPGVAPKPGQIASVRQPLGEQYIPAQPLEQWRSGRLSTAEVQQSARPTAELPQGAVRATGGTVPFSGQGMRAFGESLGETYRNPYKLGAELAADYFLGGAPTAARIGLKGYEAFKGIRGARELEKYGFTPMTPAEQAALRSGAAHPEYSGVPTNPATGRPISPQELAAQQAAQQAARDQQAAEFAARKQAEADALAAREAELKAQGEAARAKAEEMLGMNKPAPETPVAPEGIFETAPVAPKAEPAPAPAPVVDNTTPMPPAPVSRKLTPAELAKNQADVTEALKRSGISGRGFSEELADVKAGKPFVPPEPKPAPVEAPVAPAVPESSVGPAPTPFETVKPVAPEVADIFETAGTRVAAPETAPVATGEVAARTDVRSGLKQTGKAAVQSRNNTIILDKKLYDDLVAESGLPALDWSKLPNDYKSKSITEARKAINNWVYEQSKQHFPKETRGPQMGTKIKQEEAAKSAEQKASEAESVNARLERWKRGGVRAPRDTMEMMSNESTNKFSSKQDFQEAQMMDKLAGKFTEGEFTEGNKRIVHYTVEAGPFVKYMSQAYDAKTGKKIGNSTLIDMKKVK